MNGKGEKAMFSDTSVRSCKYENSSLASRSCALDKTLESSPLKTKRPEERYC